MARIMPILKNISIFSLCFIGYMNYSCAQVGQKVVPVTIYDSEKKPLSLPDLGEKHLLLFYVDPDHPSQNKEFRTQLKKNPFTNENIECYGILNLKDAPLVSNSVLRLMVRKEIAGTQAYVYNDPDNSLSRAWNLGDVNNKFVVIWINKDCVIEFYKAGQLTDEEVKQVHDLIKKYKDEPIEPKDKIEEENENEIQEEIINMLIDK